MWTNGGETAPQDRIQPSPQDSIVHVFQARRTKLKTPVAAPSAPLGPLPPLRRTHNQMTTLLMALCKPEYRTLAFHQLV